MNNNLKPVTTLPPFRRLCMTIGELPSSYLETMTYYEMLLWFTKYLSDTVIPAINNNAEAVSELQSKYIELKNYVDNYFDNLDVQEEINNKLDDMAESGELTDIIAQYLQLAGILAFNTLNDLKSAENLTNGSFVETYGNTSLNDGLGRKYKIRTKTNDDVIDNIKIIGLTNYNTLVGELIRNRDIEENENQNIIMDRKFRVVDTYEYQGACQFNSNIVIVGYSGSNSKANVYDSSGNLINSYTLQNNTHCNSIIFNPVDTLFYICNGDGTIDKYSTTFVFQERITISNVYSVTIYNNVLYGITTTNKIYNFSTEEYIDLNYTIPSVLQTFVINNDKIYVGTSNANNILSFDMNGNLLNIVTLDKGNGLFPYGELESLFNYNNKIYANTLCYASSSFRLDFLNQIWETSINNNITIKKETIELNKNLYVNSTANNNPSGYENDGFNYLSELAIVYQYRKEFIPQIIISDYIGNNRLYGIFNSIISNNSTKEINLKMYGSTATLKTINNANSKFTGDIYNSSIKCASYCNFGCVCENCDVLLSDASTSITGAEFKYSSVDITNSKNHVFTARNTTFNPYTILDPTVENSTFKNILSMNFVRPYKVTFILSGDNYESIDIQVNSERHSSINSDSGLTIPTSRGDIVLKTTGITQGANVHCYGLCVSR